MQQTALDSWLRVKFVHKYQVYANTVPSVLPPGAEPEPSQGCAAKAWTWAIVCDSEETMDSVCMNCRGETIACQPDIGQRKGWWVAILDGGPKRSSFTCAVVWNLLRICIAITLLLSGSATAVVGAMLKGDISTAMRMLTDLLRSLSRLGAMRGIALLIATLPSVLVADEFEVQPDLRQDPLDVVLPSWSDAGGDIAKWDEGGRLDIITTGPSPEDLTSYWVIRRVSCSPEGPEDLPFDKTDQIGVVVGENEVAITRSGATVRYRITDRSPMRDWTSLSTAPVPALKASRVAVGGGIEQVYIAGAGVTIITPQSAINGVVTTYAACAAKLEQPTVSAH